MNISPKKIDEKYYIYKTTNLINGKYYVGFHKTNNPNDNYFGSGKLLLEAIEKYGIQNFKKEILYEFDTREEAEAKEREIVNEEFVNNRNTYNVTLGGNVCILYGEDNGFYGKKHTNEAKLKMTQSKRGNRYAFNHIFEYNGKIYHGYNELINAKLFSSVYKIRKALFDGIVQFVDPYMKQCLSDTIPNKSYIVKYDLQIAKKFADKWNAENGYSEFVSVPKQPKTYEYVKRKSSILGRKMYWNTKTLKYKYFKVDDEIPDEWVRGKPNEAKFRDKNKRKPSYEKGTVRAVCDENGKCHMIPIDSPLPKGWYNKRGSKLCLKS